MTRQEEKQSIKEEPQKVKVFKKNFYGKSYKVV